MKNSSFLTLSRLGSVVISASAAFAMVTSSTAWGAWPQLRGPYGDGHVSAPGESKVTGYPVKWSETENIRWKTEVHDRGWSTPAVMDGQVWITTATEDGHDFYVICVDADTGKIILDEKLFHSDKPEPQGNSVNSYATPSPVIEKGRVYVHFGSYGTACLDTATKKVLWKREDLPCRHYRGPASSPIMFENLLILTMDGVDVQYHVALERTTGKTVWKTDRSVEWDDQNATDQMTRDGDRRKAHSTPVIVNVDGNLQMLSAGAKAAYAYDPRTGKELWRVRHNAWSAAAAPLYRDGLAYIVTGFGGKVELLAIRCNGSGDVTDTHVAWRIEKNVPKTPSPILVDDLLFMVSDNGVLTCMEAQSGREVWREKLGGDFDASPILADGRLYFCNLQGKTFVVKPGKSYEGVATNVLSSGFMASPAVDGKAFYLRTKTHLNRVEQ